MKDDKGINPKLEAAISKMLAEVMKDETASLTDKCKVLDRALKLEQLKARIRDDKEGSAFNFDTEPEDGND